MGEGDEWDDHARVRDLEADLARERSARRTIDQALLDVIEERDRVLAQLVDAMAAGQSMEGQCHDLEDERDRLQTVVDAQAADLLAVGKGQDALAGIALELRAAHDCQLSIRANRPICARSLQNLTPARPGRTRERRPVPAVDLRIAG